MSVGEIASCPPKSVLFLPGHITKLHFPASLTIRCGHETEFSPSVYEQKGRMLFSDLACYKSLLCTVRDLPSLVCGAVNTQGKPRSHG